MGKLNSKMRNALSSKSFALPGGRYPIEDASHARNALARASGNATPAEQETIKAKVAAKFPGIQQRAGKRMFGKGGK
jgi:hypothetical protein